MFDPEDFKPIQEKITSKSVWKKADQVESILILTTVLGCVCPPSKKSYFPTVDVSQGAKKVSFRACHLGRL